MRTVFITITLILLSLLNASTAYAEGIPGYYSQHDFLTASASVYRDGLLGFVNPANLAYLENNESRFYWSTDGTDAGSFNNWGLFTGLSHLGFGALRQNFSGLKSTDYRISIGNSGCDRLAFGLAYGWSSSNVDSLKHESLIKSGLIFRPVKYISLGLTGDFSLKTSARQGVAEIGIRPLGNSQLTLFADLAMQKDTRFNKAPWSAGAAVEVVPGICLTGRYFDGEAFTAGLTVEFGRGHIGSQLHFNNEQKHSYNTYSIRSGGRRASIFPELFFKNKMYLKLNLKGRLDYQTYKYFDKATNRFLDILRDINAASDDPRIKAIAVNLSSMRVAPEHAWEIREELIKARQKGKTVIIFIDNAGMTQYHLASVADKIVLDPVGSIQLFGYTLGKTYLKGTLEKLGLGFDEWRFFKYKSAVEILSRDSMSDADREQYQDYVDDLYETMRKDVCLSRSLTTAEFDRIINQEVYIVPKDAIELGLADTLARWSDANKILKNITGSNLMKIHQDDFLANSLQSDQWGKKPKIAVVYGLGVCDMDTGIKGRWLEKVFLKLAKDKSVDAVVFRVDSPGGDALASDLVAEALKKCAKEKPVIVSQGQVAGSGGYCISMYGDKIVAGPSTITGSIGVIGGWIYDIGFSEKLGLTSDNVQRGEHADLGFGVRLPLLNITVSARNLTSEERSKIEKLIRDFYDEFVEKVASGRNMAIDEVEKIAQGHFYSGLDGKEIGLVDEIGGLMLAIEIAKKEAGIKPDQHVDLKEIPEYKGLFRIGKPAPFIGVEIEKEPVYQYIKMLNEKRGKPLPMLIPGTYPSAE